MQSPFQRRQNDNDDVLIPLWVNDPVENPAKSLLAGRPIFEDREVVQIRRPGARDWQPFPATAISHYETDPFTGYRKAVTYAERFEAQYRQFKMHQAQTRSGTPLSMAKFLTEARCAELRAMNIYTVEALAAIDGQELKNLGTGGREMKNDAEKYLKESKTEAPKLQLEADLKAALAREQAKDQDIAALKERLAAAPISSEGQFAQMSNDDLKEFIKRKSGGPLYGNHSRESLIRLATEQASK